MIFNIKKNSIFRMRKSENMDNGKQEPSIFQDNTFMYLSDGKRRRSPNKLVKLKDMKIIVV
ncbi:MAG: hypothetical protein PUB42_06835 [Firmicutes bacterium]|nr:hypothetical protein [Bacillota bacterium]